MISTEQNIHKNKQQYNALYQSASAIGIIKVIQNLDTFLLDATQTDTSWKGFYLNDFKDRLQGKKVLEIGCGDCLNAAIMTMLGAEVVANDISDEPSRIIAELNAANILPRPITYLSGDFMTHHLIDESFDFVVGKAFLHHLTIELEDRFLHKASQILKSGGQARFFEPAVNSAWLDKLRFMIPVSGRPSSLQRKAFQAWEAADPHPDRSNASEHYKMAGLKHFNQVEIYCIGAIQKLHRLLPEGNFNRKFRRWAFKFEKLLPRYINNVFARSQLIVCRKSNNP